MSRDVAGRIAKGRAQVPAAPRKAPAIVHEVLRSPGKALDAGTRDAMESRFDHDFSRVRIHADAPAAESAKALGARAWTVGQHIAFAEGRYGPETERGRRLLAHELAHVVQSPSLLFPEKGLSIAHPDSREEQTAQAVAEGRSSAAGPAGTASSGMLFREPEKWSLDPAQATTAVPFEWVLAEFDTEQFPGWKPWKLDKVTKDIAAWLAESPENYVEIVGNYGGSAPSGKPDDYNTWYHTARERAELVERALHQWAPRFKGRLRVSTFGVESPQSAAEFRQITLHRAPFPGLAQPAGRTGAPPGGTPAPGGAPAQTSGPASASAAPETASSSNEESAFKQFFDTLTGKGWDVTVSGETVFNISYKGLTKPLIQTPDLKANLVAGPSLKLVVDRGKWHFEGSVSYGSGAWEVKLAFPRETPLPDLTRLEAVMQRGREAAIKALSMTVDPAFHQRIRDIKDFEGVTGVIDQITPLVDPIRHAVEAGMGFKKEEKTPKLEFGLAVGSGGGPGSRILTPEENAASPKGVYARGVLTLRF